MRGQALIEGLIVAAVLMAVLLWLGRSVALYWVKTQATFQCRATVRTQVLLRRHPRQHEACTQFGDSLHKGILKNLSLHHCRFQQQGTVFTLQAQVSGPLIRPLKVSCTYPKTKKEW